MQITQIIFWACILSSTFLQSIPLKTLFTTLLQSKTSSQSIDNPVVAIWHGKINLVNKLLDQKPHLITYRDKFGNTTLIAAVSHKKNKILEQLITLKAPLDEPDNNGLTSLHWACITGNHEGAQLLLKQGADPDKQDNIGQTPLHYCCLITDELLINILSEKGSPDILNNAKKISS
jgi:ankyrin repeat protein